MTRDRRRTLLLVAGALALGSGTAALAPSAATGAFAAPATILRPASVPGIMARAAAVPRAPGPLTNPTRNIATPLLSYSPGFCTGQESNGVVSHCSSPCYPSYHVRAGGTVTLPLADTPACTDLMLRAIDAAQVAEHARRIVLPRNYYHLSVPEQLFVLTNLERVTRGIPPLVGLVPYLDAAALAGARIGADPVLSPVTYNSSFGDWQSGPVVIADHYQGGTSIWSGDNSTPASAMFGWMYNDGWGGSRKATSNFACTSPQASGCWGHRDNILGAYFGPGCRTCVAGAGYASSSAPGHWTTSFAMIFLQPANSLAMSFTWNADVLPELAARYERVRAA
jgi:hypothetical protein